MLDCFLLLVVSHWVNYEDLSLQDGAPPRFAFPVRAWLDSRFPGRCMGCRGPVEWLPCDIFSCAWSNEEVCRSKPRQTMKNKFGYFCHFFSIRRQEECRVCVFGFAEACAKVWSLRWNLTLSSGGMALNGARIVAM